MAAKRKKKNKHRQGSTQEGPTLLPKKSEAWYESKAKLGFLLAAIGFLVYANTLGHGYVLDDNSVIKNNWVVQQGSEGISTLWETSYRYGYWNIEGSVYRPLSLIMFALEWGYAPDDPFVGHAVNVILYALMIFLLFLTLASIFKERMLFCFIAVLLFTLHPIHTEVVANIKSRDELLSVFLTIVAFFFWIKYLDRQKILHIGIAMGAYFLAFLAKEGIITFIAIFALTAFFYRKDQFRKGLVMSALMVIPAVIYLYIKFRVLGEITPGSASIAGIDNFLVDIENSGERLATSVYIMGMYFWKMILPHPLSCDYSYNEISKVGLTDWRFLASAALYIGIVSIAVRQLTKRTIISFSILFFIITFSIYTNLIITIGTSFSERLLFLPVLGFCLALAHFILKYTAGDNQDFQNLMGGNLKLLTVLLVICVIYTGKTLARNADWESNYILFSQDVTNSPNSARIHYLYALWMVDTKAMQSTDDKERSRYLNQAIGEYKKAVTIYANYPEAYNGMGVAYFRLNDYEKATENYNISLRYNPTYAIAYSNLGAVYFNSKQIDKAKEVYLKAVNYDPRYSDAWLNLGSANSMLGNFEEAVDAYKNCLKYDPNNATATKFLGMALRDMGKAAEAQPYFDRANILSSQDVTNSPNSAQIHYNYGLDLQTKAMQSKDDKERSRYLNQAIGEYKKAVTIDPQYAAAYNEMGLAYFRLNDYEKAVENYNISLRYNPTYAAAYSNLGAVYFNSKQIEKAREVYLKAVHYDPRYSDAWLNLGSANANLGNFEEAVNAYKNCLKYDPNNATVTYFLGSVLRNMGKAAEAQAYLDRAYQLNPELRKETKSNFRR